MSVFNVNTPFWQFLNKMADVFLLSLLWMVCSIPVITFGASTTAFVSVSMKLHKDCEGSLMKDFFSVFRRCFRRSTLLWLSQIMIFAVLAADMYLCWRMESKIGAFFLPVFAVLTLLLLMASYYTWPLVSHSKEGLLKTWRLAMHLVLTFLPHSLAMLILEGLGAVVAFMYPSLSILIPFIVCYQFARVFAWTFPKSPLVRDSLDSSASYCNPGAEGAENKTIYTKTEEKK